MPYRLVCPHCDQLLGVEERFLGTELMCPHCQQVFRAPPRIAEQATEGPEPPPRIGTGLPKVEVSETEGEFITIPTEDGRSVTIREPVKTVRKGARVVALRTLSPEEKRRRRARKNAVFFVLGVLLLALALAVLQRLAA